MKLYYITKNPLKFRRAKEFFKNTDIELKQLAIDTPEIQEESPIEIAKASVKFVARKINQPLIKLDTAFYIEALNGFPGPFVKYINNWLTPEQILTLMKKKKNRKAYWIDAIALFLPGKPIKVFSSKEEGTIALKPQGENGWGVDKIFIPKGAKTTKANLNDKERLKISNKQHWLDLIAFLKSVKI